jgi:peptide/nickel transport system substrate-binding protein
MKSHIKRLLACIAVGVLLAVGSPIRLAVAETVLRIGEASHGDIDPHQGALFADAILYNNIYDALVFPSVDGKTTEMRPHLAESIDVDPTGTVYTIKLRANVKFHSGNTMTADDVVFSMNRMLAIQKGFSFLFTGVVKSAEAKGPLTVVFTLEKPAGAFYSGLVRLGIVDSKTVMANKQAGDFGEFGDYGGKWLLHNSAGTGAYKVVSHKRTERTKLIKFKDYFLGHQPKAPDVAFFTYANIDLAVIAMFKRGEMDVVRPLIQPETKKELLKIKGVTLAAEPGVNQQFFWLNNTRAPLDDVNCRRALAYAVDYEVIHSLEEIRPGLTGAKASHGPLLETMAGFDPELPPFAKRDLAKAKAYLAKCKYKPANHRIDIAWISTNLKSKKFALILQSNWKDLGFESDIQSLVWAHYVTRLAKAETAPMVSPVYVSPAIPDPDSYLYQSYHSSRGGQWSAGSYFSDAEVDKMLEKGRTMSFGPERTNLYKKASARIRDQQAAIFAMQLVNLWAKRDTFDWPQLETPGMNNGVQGANLIIRLMEMRNTN